ncbi:retrovirus-related pol polyprotein from transposon TNT 1-94 [Tanacetum coccineum]
MLDELLTPPPSVDHLAPEVIAPITDVVAPEPTASTGSCSSTTIDQDAPLPSNSQTTPETQSPIIPNDVEEDNHDLDVAHMNNDPYFGIPILEVPSDQSLSTDFIHKTVHPDHQISEHNSKWTKDHPLENIIGELARPIEAMQEELNEFERLGVWELIPRLDKVIVITLKWINKVRLDELGAGKETESTSALKEKTSKTTDKSTDGSKSQHKSAGESAHTEEPMHIDKDLEEPAHQEFDGLKQAPCAWYDMLSSFLISQDFSKGSMDPTLFIRREGKELLLVQIYVDDIIFATSRPKLCDLFAKIMCLKFKMSMMGKISFFLGLQISQSPRGIFINQSKYSHESLKKYDFDSCDPVDTPMVEKSKLDEDKKGKAIDSSHYRGMIGTLLYLTASRPDLQFAIRMNRQSGTMVAEALTAFADANHVGCQDTRRSTSGSMQFLGDRLVRWSSKRQKSAAISSMKAEYIALFGYCAQHIDIRFHFIKEQVENGVVELYFVNTEYQLADIFTKALCREIIEFLINKLGMQSLTPETLKQLADEAEE